MSNATGTFTKRWRDIVNLVLGAWLFVSPWVLHDAPTRETTWNAYLMGAIIVIAAICALAAFQEWEEWLNAVAGVWLVISPWVMGVAMGGLFVWSCLIVGVVVGLLALWSLVEIRAQGAHA